MMMGLRKNKNTMVSAQGSNLFAGEYGLVKNHSSSVKKPMNKYVIVCALLASMNSMMLGYDGDDAAAGVMSGAILFIQEELHITEVEEEMLIGSSSIVSLLGAAVAGRTSDAIGRRRTMALEALIFLMGAAIMGLAPSFAVLMGGRLLVGISVGFGLSITPVYTAEVSPASSRGALASFPEIFVNAGILMGYISNYFLSGLPAHLSWRLMLDDQAEVDARLAEIIEAAGQDRNLDMPSTQTHKKGHGDGVWREIFWPNPPIGRMLMIALGIQFFEQATGIDAVVYYSPAIFKDAGIQSQAGLLSTTLVVGFAKTAFVLVATFFIDRVGRRTLLLTSTLGMTASLLALASVFSFIQNASRSHEGAVFLAVLAVCCNVAFFSIGLGPVCWLLNSEIFPLRLRAQAVSLGVVVNRAASAMVAMTFPSVARAITAAGTFFFFAGLSILCAVFVYSYVPETKGKTLEEIETFFHKDSHKMSREGKSEPWEVENSLTSPLVSTGV
eukprot:Gb_04394 [translate_table: standard]